MDFVIRLEEEKDFEKVEFLTREAFWDLYGPGCDEHLILHKLRKSPAFVKELSYVVDKDNHIIGNVVYTIGKVTNGNKQVHEVLCMVPISVLPEYQGKGIGSKLLEESLKKAKVIGYKGVVIFGNPKYYQRFGFENAKKYGIQTSEGENFDEFMALELEKEGLKGITGKFHIDSAFEVNKEELETFEKGFPPKEKNFKL